MKKKAVLICNICLARNYQITCDPKTQIKRIELKKYCKVCKKHTLHKQS